jgi:hypothetical protein
MDATTALAEIIRNLPEGWDDVALDTALADAGLYVDFVEEIDDIGEDTTSDD